MFTATVFIMRNELDEFEEKKHANIYQPLGFFIRCVYDFNKIVGNGDLIFGSIILFSVSILKLAKYGNQKENRI